MTFGREIVVWCVAGPIIVSALACLLAVVIHRRWPASRWGNVWVGVGWWIAVVGALTARQGWQWWPEDAWRQQVWPLLAWAVLLGGASSRQLRRPAIWVIAGVLASTTALIAMPGGDQWSDTFHLHRVWMCAVATSCLLNGFAVSWMANHGAGRWVLLVALTVPAGSLLLAGSAYGSLAEWALAITVATICVAIWGLFPTLTILWTVAFPTLAAGASVTAAARFYTYDDISPWVYGVVLFGPALIAVADSFICRRPPWVRILVSACVALALLGSCVWAVLLS